MQVKKILPAFCLLFLLQYLPAQKFNFRNYSVVNGLGSSNINHIFQDKKGYIWFATQGGGASRFNGNEFKNFTKADGLISNDVTFITEDKDGNIWIGTGIGASKFDGTAFTSFGAQQGLTDNTVYGIYPDDNGEVWFALKDAGVRIYNGRCFRSISVKNGLPCNDVYAINRDVKGNYWLGLANGIAMYNGRTVQKFDGVKYIHDKIFFSTATDDNENIWFGSASGEVVIIHPNGQTELLPLPKALAGCFIGGIAKDNMGNMWMATDHGAVKYKNHNFKVYTEQQGLSVSTTQTVICDYEGNIWIGTLGGGANLLSSEAFTAYTQADGLLTNNVACIYNDTNTHTYYVGTNGHGLFTFNPENAVPFKSVTDINELKNINITSVYVDRTGLLWLTAQEGVFVIENRNGIFSLKHNYQKIAGQKLISPQQLIQDRKGNTWIATFGSGIFEITGGKEKYYATSNGFLSDNILTVFNDNQDNIWIGTFDAGAIKYNGRDFSTFNPGAKFVDKAVWSITEDNAGNMYFGTGENGLYTFDVAQNKLSNYRAKNGLCSDYIPAVKWDIYQNALWLGSEKGVNKIIFDDKQAAVRINTYNQATGYNSWGINQNSILTDNQGQIWFCSVNGLWRYAAINDFTEKVPPKIQLSEIRLAYQKVNWGNYCSKVNRYTNLPIGLKLSYKNNHLTFDVKALSTSNISYSYMLEGQDNDWSPLTTNTEANYSNISPGRQYVFKARAVNSKGVWSAETVEFPFTIEPAWWNTWLFRSILFLIIIIVITIIIKVREKALRTHNLKLEKTVVERTAEVVQQKEQSEQLRRHTEKLNHQLGNKNVALEKLNQEKNNFLGIVAHDLKNPLGIVRTLAEISADPETTIDKRQHYLQNIAIATERMYELVNNLLDINSIESGKINLHIERVNLKALVSELAEQVSSLARARNIRIITHLPVEEIMLSTDKARLTQVLENYSSNALKYSPPDTTINIYLSNTVTDIEVKIKDEGPGIDISEQEQLFTPYGVTSTTPYYGENKTGLGLAIVKKIAEALQAHTGCRSDKGFGCEFYIRFSKN